MVRIGPGQAGGGTDGGDTDTGDDGGTTDAADTPRERAVDQEPEPDPSPDPEPSPDPADTPRERAVDQEPDPAPDPEPSPDPADTPRERAVDQEPDPAPDPEPSPDPADTPRERAVDQTPDPTGDTAEPDTLSAGEIERSQQMDRGVGRAAAQVSALREQAFEETEIERSQQKDRAVGLANREIAARREQAFEETEIERSQQMDRAVGLASRGISGRRRAAARGEQTEVDDGDGGIVESIMGPPGEIESAIGFAATDPIDAVTGAPGTLESEVGYAVSDPIGAITGAPGSIEAGAGDIAFGVRDVSAGAAEAVGPPVADFLGDAFEFSSRGMLIADPMAPAAERDAEARGQYVQSGLDAQRAPEDELTETTFAERLGEGVGQGAVDATIGLPAGAVDTGALAADAGEFTAREIEAEGVVEGGISSSVAGGEFAYQTGETVAQQATENPAFFTGMIAGGAAGGVASTPFRLSRLDVPEGGGGTTAVRGLRVREPAIVRPLTGRQRGRTVAGARGYRPTLGAPSLRNVDVDYTGLGTTGTATAEAMSSFEADVFRSTAADIGGESRQQFSAAESIQRQAAGESRAGFQFDTAEEALGEARAVPESAVPDVADALRDTDATVFGSVATRARVEGFRQPRDIDITLRESRQAPKSAPIEEQFPESGPRLQQALEGEQATVGDVFDIKTEAEAPGRAFGGEEIKYGFESMEPDTLGGVRFNPAEEELIRKAGASAFIREPGAAGTPDLDVGPEPRRPGRVDVREKDVTDTAAIADELLGEGTSAEFETAFGLTQGEPSTGLFTAGREAAGDLTAPDSLRAFREDTRAQLGAGAARTQPDAPERQQTPDVDATTADVTEQVTSPATSPGGAGAPVAVGAFGVSGTPDVDLDANSPSPTPRQPTGGDVFSPSPDISPDAGGGTVGEIFGGSPTATGDTTETTTPSPVGEPTGQGNVFTGEPTDATDSPPTTTTSPPFTPTTSPPPTGGPPTSPPPSGPPTTAPPFISPPTGGPPDQPTTRTVTFERGDEGDDETPFQPKAPAGEEFVNPVATGQQFLFGGFGGGGQSENDGNGGNGQNGDDDVMSLFTG